MAQSMVFHRIVRVGAIGAAGLMIAAAKPSFDCAHSPNPVDQAVCADESLGRLDTSLAEAYATMLAQPHTNGERLRREQLDWLKFRDATCGPDPMPMLGIGSARTTTSWRSLCLSQLYRQRIGDLKSPISDDAPPLSQAPDALCDALMQSLPAPQTLVEGDAVDIIAKRAGGLLIVDPPPSRGLSIENLNDGAGECPAIRIYQNAPKGRVVVKLPSGAGSYCGEIPINQSPRFSIANISGTQALLTRFGPDLDVTSRNNDRWGKTCSIHLKLAAAYSISASSCQGADCTFLEHVAPRLADLITWGVGRTTPGLIALWNSAPSPIDEQRWEIMRRIGLSTLKTTIFVGAGKNSDEHLTYFDDQSGAAASSYDGVKTPGEVTAFAPIKFGDELLLGKIGAAGFGCCSVSATELLSVYRLSEDRLWPIASFVMKSSGNRFAFAEEN